MERPWSFEDLKFAIKKDFPPFVFEKGEKVSKLIEKLEKNGEHPKAIQLKKLATALDYNSLVVVHLDLLDKLVENNPLTIHSCRNYSNNCSLLRSMKCSLKRHASLTKN